MCRVLASPMEDTSTHPHLPLYQETCTQVHEAAASEAPAKLAGLAMSSSVLQDEDSCTSGHLQAAQTSAESGTGRLKASVCMNS